MGGGLAGMKPQSFCDLTWKVTSHHFHHSLFLRNKSFGPVHTERERITQEQQYQEEEIIGTRLRRCLTQCFRIIKLNPFILQMEKIRLRFRGLYDSPMAGKDSQFRLSGSWSSTFGIIFC